MTPLCEIGTKYGTDKAPWCWGYTKVYAEWVPKETRVVLELGVLSGASLRMWRDYLPSAMVYGIDNDANCMVTGEPRIETFCFNAYDLRELMETLEKIGPIELFIDDALHDPRVQIPMLLAVWPHLRSGGVYAIEDIMTGKMVTNVEGAIEKLEGVAKHAVYLGKEGFAMAIMRKA